MSNMSKPIWFVFPGLEAYEATPPESMLTFPPFVKICDSFYERTGINLIETILKEGSSPRIATVFASVTAIQTALANWLGELGIRADGFIGYGIGEFACSYLDGCYEAETAILLSHTIGKKIDESGSRRGSMAIVEQNEAEFTKFFSNSGVFVSAHNTDECITISGSEYNVAQVLEKLKMDKIKCRTLQSYRTALHCPQMDYLGDIAMESLYRIIDSPKPRSNRWVSTTVAATEECLRLSCPRYFLRNLCSPILFREACTEIPSDCIVIEINYRALLERFVTSNLNSQQAGLMTYLTIPCLDDENNLLTDTKLMAQSGLTTDKLVNYLRDTKCSGIYQVR